MKKLISITTSIILTMAAFTSCGAESGTVSTDGSTSMEKVVGALGEAFMEDNKNITFTYNLTGSGSGITAGALYVYAKEQGEFEVALDNAVQDGRSEIEVSRNGHEYQLNISSIGSDEQKGGVVILVFDISDKVFAERNRKEFTANVSHELKTPLQSIMGSAELLRTAW